MRNYFYARIRPVGVLFFRNLRYLIILILIPITIIIGITIFSLSQFINSEITMYSVQSLNNYYTFTETLFSNYFFQTAILGNDSDVQLFFLSSTTSKPYYNYRALEKSIKNLMSGNEIVNSIYLHALSSDQLFTDRGLRHLDSFYDSQAIINYETYASQNKRSWFLYRKNENGIPIIAYYQLIGSPSSPRGVIIINFDFNKLSSQIKGIRGEYDNGLFIADSTGTLVGTVFDDTSSTPSSEFAARLLQDNSHTRYGHYIYHTVPITYTDWHFILSIPTSVSYSKLLDVIQPILLIFFVTLFCIMAATFYISIQLYHPIRSIMQSLIETVPEYAEIQNNHPEEESFILTVVMNTIEKNRHMSEEITTYLKTLKKAQSIALQSQINPHFLYNTLDCINWSAMGLTRGQNEVSVMITKLASMLRYSLEDVNTLVTFEKELQHAHDYLDLQATRYMNRFQTQWHICPDLLQYPIIKIVLQPLLENAIYHGIKPLPAKTMGLITICAECKEDTFLISVSDNGVGMQPEPLEELNQSFLSDDIRQKAHIGLRNVNQRIKLIFGNTYGLSVSSVLGEGTTVSCRLPLLPSETAHTNL